MVDNVIILAGGSGTRLWPASVAARPKQFLDPGTGRSLLQMTVQRAGEVAPKATIVIVTHHSQLQLVLDDCLKLGGLIGPAGAAGAAGPAGAAGGSPLRERIVILPEPAMRNTAPALAFALTYLNDTGAANETSLVLASDHLITPVDQFAQDVATAVQLAKEDLLVTFGVTPSRPETGYGYIEAGTPHGGGHRIASFREKPDAQTAQNYLNSGTFFWNSGMFVFRNSTLQQEIAALHPDITTPFDDIETLTYERRRTDLPQLNREGITVAWQSSYMTQLYNTLPKISIDYAVMERSEKGAMIKTHFQWNDVGSWDEMAQLTDDGVIGRAGDNSFTSPDSARQPAVQIESTNNYIYSELPVVLCGVSDLEVIVKNGKVLVSKRGSAQLVRDAVETLRDQGHADLT